MINRILLPNLVLADPVLENVDFRVSDISGGESLNPNISRAMCNVRPTLRLRSGQAGFDVNDLRRSCSWLTLSKALLRRAETLAAT